MTPNESRRRARNTLRAFARLSEPRPRLHVHDAKQVPAVPHSPRLACLHGIFFYAACRVDVFVDSGSESGLRLIEATGRDSLGAIGLGVGPRGVPQKGKKAPG